MIEETPNVSGSDDEPEISFKELKNEFKQIRALHVAAADTESTGETVETLVSTYGLDVNQLSSSGSAPLHIAVWQGNLGVVISLLLLGASVDIHHAVGGWTPLHLAARQKNEELVNVLLDAGADINSVDKMGYSVLSHAVIGGEVGVVNYLIANKVEVNQIVNKEPTTEADEVRSRLEAPYLNPGVCKIRTENCGPPDFSFVRFGHDKAELGGGGCFPGSSSSFASSAFSSSSLSFGPFASDAKEVDSCLSSSSSPPPVVYLSPLHVGSICGSVSMVRSLIHKGQADINIKDSLGRSPIILALIHSNFDVVDLLHKSGARVNQPDNMGRTILHHAVIQNNKKMVSVALELGAKVTQKDGNGATALDMAGERGGTGPMLVSAAEEYAAKRKNQSVICLSLLTSVTAGAFAYARWRH
eukprot:CAMPEP_0174254842 /NCGR_PEP_ID=MMETSP0439-20130205/4170_1 /TAXON_ID=0 /ORGANISM="Stereomyxa ramosa, Strain Chinc5" /LENGTH=414 /DNA_ID=CAMNT_0015336705 /DNA_START=37 /DNA_END=1281 /DNA_ORIENTATION=+